MSAEVVNLYREKIRENRRNPRKSNRASKWRLEIVRLIERSKLTVPEIVAKSDGEITTSTIYNWQLGYTLCPRIEKMEVVLRVLGFHFEIMEDR